MGTQRFGRRELVGLVLGDLKGLDRLALRRLGDKFIGSCLGLPCEDGRFPRGPLRYSLRDLGEFGHVDAIESR